MTADPTLLKKLSGYLIKAGPGGYLAEKKLLKAFPSLTPDTLSAALWEILLQGHAPVHTSVLLELLQGQPAESAAQLFELCRRYALDCPDFDKEPSNPHNHWAGKIPGYVNYLESFLGRQPRALLAAFAPRAQELPAPLSTSVPFLMATLGLSPVSVVDPSLLPIVAAQWLTKEAPNPFWYGTNPWPEELMAAAMREALQDPTRPLKSPSAFVLLLKHGEDPAYLLERFDYTSHHDLVREQLAALGPQARPSLIELLTRRPSLSAVAVVPLLELYQAAGETPPDSLDALLQACMLRFERYTNWNLPDDASARAARAWRSLTLPRLQRLLESCPEYPWYLAGVAPSQALMERGVKASALLPSYGAYSVDGRLSAFLLSAGPLAMPSLAAEALAGSPHKEHFVTAVVACQDDAAIAPLVRLLALPEKKLRARVSAALSSRPKALVLPLLAPLLDSEHQALRDAASALQEALRAKES